MIVVVILHDDIIMIHKTSNVWFPKLIRSFKSMKKIPSPNATTETKCSIPLMQIKNEVSLFMLYKCDYERLLV